MNDTSNPGRRAAALACALGAAIAGGNAFAQDRAEVDRTQITGSRELPKVLYIVPWKKPLPGDLAGRPMASVLDEALAPLDRDVVRRQVQYDAETKARAAATAPLASIPHTASPPPTGATQ